MTDTRPLRAPAACEEGSHPASQKESSEGELCIRDDYGMMTKCECDAGKFEVFWLLHCFPR
jgi:hypothetical protein